MVKRIFYGIILASLFLGIPLSSINSSIAEYERVIRIIDAETGLDSITLGSETKPMPSEGYPFTVNVTLDGLTEDLFTYQITVGFNTTKINCTAAWIPEDDPNFVFYGKQIVNPPPNIEKANEDGYIVVGAALPFGVSVDVSQGIFCQINFTAIKTGMSTLNIVPTFSSDYSYDTFLWNTLLDEIPFTSESFSVTAFAGSSLPIAFFTFSPLNPIANQTVTFLASGSYDPDGDVTSYVWDFGDGNITALSYPAINHSYTLMGIYFVNLTVFDNDEFYNSLVQSILVGRIPYVYFTYEPTEIEVGTVVTFNASGSYDPDGDITVYVWDFGDGTNATTTNATMTHIFDQDGIYDVKLTVFDNDGLYNSTAQYIFVGKRPIAEFTFSPENPDPDEEIIFDASLSYDLDGQIVYAIWDFGDLNVTEVNVKDPTDLVIAHVYIAVGGVYPVNLTVFDDDGLYSSVVHDVNVTVLDHCPYFKIFNVVWSRTVYRVLVSSNSTITRFRFNQSLAQISFEVSGGTGAIGYCNVTIPNALLMGNPWEVKINGQAWSFTPSNDATRSFIYFTYTHASPLLVTIKGPWVVPEFPSTIILVLAMVFTTIALIGKKKLANKHQFSVDN